MGGTEVSLHVCLTLCKHDSTGFGFCRLSQWSRFVQNPGVIHLEAAERLLQYVRATHDEGITYCDPGPAMKNKLAGMVDSDFGSDVDPRKSMTGYLMSLHGGPISWKSSASRQGWRDAQQQ